MRTSIEKLSMRSCRAGRRWLLRRHQRMIKWFSLRVKKANKRSNLSNLRSSRRQAFMLRWSRRAVGQSAPRELRSLFTTRENWPQERSSIRASREMTLSSSRWVSGRWSSAGTRASLRWRKEAKPFCTAHPTMPMVTEASLELSLPRALWYLK